MKLKQSPADFRVEELTAVTPSAGPFALYRLDKSGWTTPDAIGLVRRAWNLDAARVSTGGLKDRHAETTQHLTVWDGPARDFARPGVSLRYLGQTPAAFTSADIAANRFVVTVRHLKPVNVERATAAAAAVERDGLPNYFDDQRFGSVAAGQPFIAREMVAGRFEAALRLALAEPYEFDRPADRKDKATLRGKWGDWPACKASLGRGHARSLVDYLVHHPADFRGAVARLRPELQGLYLSAYQSHVWNRTLDRWLRQAVPADRLGGIGLKLGPVAVPVRPVDLPPLPLPSARLKPPPDAPWLPALAAVLADDGLTLEGMRIPGLDKPFFSRGERPTVIRPVGLTADPGDDEANRGRLKLVLRFDLPRGSYATVVVKRLTAFTGPPAA
jgi:tRNA pseudouridine13 synthase